MSKVKEIVAIALALIGWITAIVACVLPLWKASVLEAGRGQIIWEGLWMSCVVQSSGQRQCKTYESLQTLPSDLQAARDMIVISIITILLPLVLSIMGAKCTNCIDDKASKVMTISGVFFIITGCLVFISASWITYVILYSQHRVLGASLYFGFAAAALLIAGGVLLCCTCLPREGRAVTSASRYQSLRMKIGAITLGLIGLILSIVTFALPMWRVTTFIASHIITSQVSWEGLWMSCVVQSTGQMQCKTYDSMLALPSDLQAARAMTVISTIMTLLALIIFIMGTKCTNGTEDKVQRGRYMIISGVFLIISGILVLIPVSWISKNIVQDFYNPLLSSAQRIDFGASLYTGFAAAGLLIIGGGLLICAACVRR